VSLPGGTVADVELIRFRESTRAITALGGEALERRRLDRTRGESAVRIAVPAPGSPIGRCPAATRRFPAVTSDAAAVSEGDREVELGPGDGALRDSDEPRRTQAPDVIVGRAAPEPVVTPR